MFLRQGFSAWPQTPIFFIIFKTLVYMYVGIGGQLYGCQSLSYGLLKSAVLVVRCDKTLTSLATYGARLQTLKLLPLSLLLRLQMYITRLGLGKGFLFGGGIFNLGPHSCLLVKCHWPKSTAPGRNPQDPL